jgi:hypothetical protein
MSFGPEASPVEPIADHNGPTSMVFPMVKRIKITLEEFKRGREGRLCIYCRDNRHFMASRPSKLKAPSGKVEINQCKEESVKRNKTEVESGNLRPVQ